MSCEAHLDTIVELARGAGADSAAVARARTHLEDCHDCAAMLAAQRRLTNDFRLLQRLDGPGDAAALEARLLDRFSRSSRNRSRLLPWAALAAAAVLVLTVTLAPQRSTETSAVTPLARVTTAAPAEGLAELSAFLPLYGAGPPQPEGSGMVVRIGMPAHMLSALGVPAPPAIDGESVVADVWVGRDGVARGIRVVF